MAADLEDQPQSNSGSGGDRISVGNISGSYAAIGAGAQVIVNEALSAVDELDKSIQAAEKRLAEAILRLLSRYTGLAAAGETEGLNNPYKSLDDYKLEDAPYFYGRAEAIAAMRELLSRSRLTILESDSGSGKSSLMQAGLASRLLADGDFPLYIRAYNMAPEEAIKKALLPGYQSRPELARFRDMSLLGFLQSVTSLLGEQQIVVFLDQFEEFFTELGPQEQEDFAAHLRECVQSDLPVRWVLALRKEYLSELRIFEALRPFNNRFFLPAFNIDEAQQVLVEPAALKGVGYEAGLVARILADIQRGSEGIAPVQVQLVCYTLFDELLAHGGSALITHELYDRRRGRGEGQPGAQGILTSHLTRVLDNQLTGQERKVARRVLEALVTSDLRRTVQSEESLALSVEPEEAATFEHVLGVLDDNRLVRRTVDEEDRAIYELTHDYLLDEITLDPDTQALKAAQELLAQELVDYRRYGTLLGREKFDIINSQRAQMKLDPQSEELLHESERELTRQARRRRMITAAVAAALLVLAVAAVYSAVDSNRNATLASSALVTAQAAQAQAEIAAINAEFAQQSAEANQFFAEQQRDIAATARVDADVQRDAAVNAEATAEAEAAQARRSLSGQIATQSQLVGDTQPQLRTLLALESLRTTQDREEPDVSEAVEALRDALQGISGTALTPYEGSVRVLTVSPDGRYVMTAEMPDGISAQLWDLSQTDPTLNPVSLPKLEEREWKQAQFSARGEWLAAATEEKLLVWNLERGVDEGLPYVIEAASGNLAFSPNGLLLAGIDAKGMAIKIWRLDSTSGPQLLGQLDVPQDDITQDVEALFLEELAFSPDSRWLLGRNNRTLFRYEVLPPKLYAWDLLGGELDRAEAQLVSDNEAMHYGWNLPFTAAFDISPDSKRLVVANNNGRLAIWDMQPQTGPANLLQEIDAGAWYQSVAYSADGRWLAAAATDTLVSDDLSTSGAAASLRLWPIAEDGTLGDAVDLVVDQGAVANVKFSNDAEWLAASVGGFPFLWELRDGEVVDRTPAAAVAYGSPGQETSVGFDQDSSLFTISGGQTIQVWPLRQGRPVDGQTFAGHEGQIMQAKIGKDRRWLFSAAEGANGWGTFTRLWDLSDLNRNGLPISLGSVRAIAASADGTRLATANESGIALWDLADFALDSRPEWVLSDPEYLPTSLAFSADGSLLAVGDEGGRLRLVRLTPRTDNAYPVETIATLDFQDLSLAFSEDNQYLLAGSSTDGTERTVHLWNLAQIEDRPDAARLTADFAYIASRIVIDPNSKWAAVIGNGDLLVWQIQPEVFSEPQFIEGGISQAAFSADGRWLAGFGPSNTAAWSLEGAGPPEVAPISFPPAHSAAAVAFLPQSDELLLSDHEGTVYLVDLQEPPLQAEQIPPQRLRELSAHLYAPPASYHGTLSDYYSSGLFDTTSQTLAVGDEGGLLLWDWSFDKTAADPIWLDTGIHHPVAYSRDGRWLVTSGLPNYETAYLWPMDTAELVDFACRTVGRNLSEMEWSELFRNQPYRETCDF